MNPHYHPYSDLSSPHPPSPDNNNYPPMPGAHHHNGHMGPMDGQQGFHQMNNNNAQNKYCGGCNSKITDRFLLHALEQYWHNSCLKCHCCHEVLADIGRSCFVKGGMILCKNDYTKLFRSPNACSACGQMIPSTEMVMRTASQTLTNGVNNNNNYPNQPTVTHYVYHLKCFQCSKCGHNLQRGERYYMVNGNLHCETDWHKVMKASNAPNPPLRKGKVGRPRRSRD